MVNRPTLTHPRLGHVCAVEGVGSGGTKTAMELGRLLRVMDHVVSELFLFKRWSMLQLRASIKFWMHAGS